MIKNDRQWRITKAQLARFEKAQAELGASEARDTPPLLKKAQVEATRSQIEELQAEVSEYEGLLSGHRAILEMQSLEDLPRSLIRARIAARLSQKELAERLGLKEQQIQRYEATEYASASLSRIQDVATALGMRFEDSVFLPNAKFSFRDLVARLKAVGVDRDLILRRLVPRSLASRLSAEAKGEGQGSAAIEAVSRICRVFGWTPAGLLGTRPLSVSHSPLEAAWLKAIGRRDTPRLAAYTVYAHYLALLVLELTQRLLPRTASDDAAVVSHQIVSTYGSLTLDSALSFLWDLGIPVLPLRDPGAFHGAYWRVSRRGIIVLKQVTCSWARWLFDLLHELWHAAQEPDRGDRTSIDLEGGAQGTDVSPEEEKASVFAGNVLLGGRAEALAAACVSAASGKVEWLKRAVPKVAAQENVPVDVLANYMAWRLSMQRINWWGTAQTLQQEGPEPFEVCRDFLLRRLDLAPLSPVDRELLLRALSSWEETP